MPSKAGALQGVRYLGGHRLACQCKNAPGGGDLKGGGSTPLEVEKKRL